MMMMMTVRTMIENILLKKADKRVARLLTVDGTFRNDDDTDDDDDGDDDDDDDHPHYYQLLADTVASFRDVGQDYIQYDKITQKPFLM